MMVKKFEDWISEGLWSKGIERSKTGDVRMENGRKVKSSVGDILIRNNSTDYENIIKVLLDHINTPNGHGLELTFINYQPSFDYDNPYTQRVNDDLVAMYTEYDNLIEYSEFEPDELSEEDYISIITTITDRLKQLNIVEKVFKLTKGKVKYEIYMPILSEDEYEKVMKYWTNTTIEKFQFVLMDEFSDDIRIHLEDKLFGLKLNYESLKNYDEIISFTKEYFKNELNEGLWSKGINRSKTGEERLEDKLNSNIKNLKEIDLGLPFLIADDDLTIQHIDEFTHSDMERYKEFVESHGWRFPTCEELQDYINSDFLEYTDGNDSMVIFSKKTKQSVTFNKDTKFKSMHWCVSDNEVKWVISGQFACCSMFYVEIHDGVTYHIRLIKDKDKHLDEGLWAKGIERSQTGDVRREKGVKVKSPFGGDLVLTNPSLDVKKYIKMIVDSGRWREPFLYDLTLYKYLDFETYKKVIRYEHPYMLPMHDGKWVIQFKSYEEVEDKDKEGITSELNEEDYYTCIKAIMDKLDNTDWVKFQTGVYFVLLDEDDINQVQKRLIKEDDLEYGEVIFDDFKDKMFDKCKDKVEIVKTPDNKNILMNYNYFTLLNYDKILKFTRNFFKLRD